MGHWIRWWSPDQGSHDETFDTLDQLVTRFFELRAAGVPMISTSAGIPILADKPHLELN